MQKVKWGILSTANIALTQLIPAIERAINAEVVAIASRSEKVYTLAEALNIPNAYESYDDLLMNEEIEVVYIPLPNHLHKEWAMKAATAGKHVLCEKPAVLTTEDLEEILTHFQKHDRLFLEAFMYQFHPQHARVKSIVESGEIGEVNLYKSSHSFFMTDQHKNIRMDATKGGGAMWDVGCYAMHALQYHLGADVKQVTFKTIEREGVDVSSFGIIELENNISALIDCSFELCNRNEYKLIGTKGVIHVKNAFRPDVFWGNAQLIITTNGQERIEYIQGDIYKLEVEYFSDAVQNTSKSLDEQHNYSRQTVRLLEQAYESMEK